MRKNIAFDLDGTILDSRYRHQKVLYDVLINNNINVELSELDDFISYKTNGKNGKGYLQEKFDNISNVDKINKEWISNIEKNEYLELDNFYENAIELLETLSKKHNLYLITARSKNKNAKKQIENMNLCKYFKEIYIVSNKVDSALEKYEVTKNKDIDLVIGDTEVDFEWAKYLNVEFLPITHGFRNNRWWMKKTNITLHPNLESITQYLYKEGY